MADHNAPNAHACAQTHRLVPSLGWEFSPRSVTSVLQVP